MDLVSEPVVIDLGYERGEPPTYRSPGRSTVSHWFPVTLLSVLVLVLATASAPPGRSPLTAQFKLSAGPADGYSVTGDGELLAQSAGRLAAYDLGTGRLRWQSEATAPSYRLRTVDGLVLMRTQIDSDGGIGTTAVSADDGGPRWARAGDVLTVPGSGSLLAVDGVQSYFGTGRRVQGTIDAIDPATGGTEWTVVVPDTAILFEVPATGDEGGRMLLVRADRSITQYDLDDGQVLATGQLPEAYYGPDNPTVAGGYLLLLHRGIRGPEISAYDPSTFKQAWTVPAQDVSDIDSCGDIACLISDDGVRGLDPATGDVLWRHAGWQTVAQQGSIFVAYGSGGSEPIAVVDPDRGRTLVPLDGWRPVTGSIGTDQLLVTRFDDAGARTMVAVARPGDSQPRLLGELPEGTGDCQSAGDRLVCRSMYGGLVVWAYRKG